MGLGPERIYESGLKPLLSQMGVHFDCEEITLNLPFPAEISAAFEVCRTLADKVKACRENGVFPIVLSGNCNAAIGTVSGCGGNNTGVVWFDAHGEATTPETTISGFLDGMGISTLAGQCWQSMAKNIPGFAPVPGKRIVLFGARDVEPVESALLDRIGVLRAATPGQLGNHLTERDFDRAYVHVDLDVLDPDVARANQWTPPNGITVECLTDAIREVRKHAEFSALGIASYDPAVDKDGKALAAAVQVTESVLAR